MLGVPVRMLPLRGIRLVRLEDEEGAGSEAAALPGKTGVRPLLSGEAGGGQADGGLVESLVGEREADLQVLGPTSGNAG
jgi:hypothetical protein